MGGMIFMMLEEAKVVKIMGIWRSIVLCMEQNALPIAVKSTSDC